MPQGKGRTARRLRRGSMVCVTAVLGLAGPAFACGETQQATPRQAPTNPPPLAVGDSVLADTVQLLAGAGYEANGMVCRTVDQGLAILRARGNQLPSLVVFALGTNGGITDSQVREALAILGPSRRLVLVTPHHGDDPNSPQAVRDEVNRYAPQTVLLDWDRLSSPHPEWFAPDGIHLGGDAGIHAFASMIISALPYATSGQVQAIPTPPPPPPTAAAPARAPHHPPAVTVFRRAARAAARGVKPRPPARALPAIVLPVKPGPQAGISIWVIVAAVAGALALALLAGLLGRGWYRRRQAVTPQPVVPAPAPPPAAPAPHPRAPPQPAPAARAPVAKRRPGLVLAGAAVAALALAAVRTGRGGPDRRRR